MRILQTFSVLSCLALAGCSANSGLGKAWSLVPFGKDKPRVEHVAEQSSTGSQQAFAASVQQSNASWLKSVTTTAVVFAGLAALTPL